MDENLVERLHALFDKAVDIIDNGKSFPFCSKTYISKRDMLEVIRGLRECIPDYVNDAYDVIRRADDILLKAQSDADVAVLSAKDKAEEIVKEAEKERERRIQIEPALCDAEDYVKELRVNTEKECTEIREEAKIFKEQTFIDIENFKQDILGAIYEVACYSCDGIEYCLSSVKDNRIHVEYESEKAVKKLNAARDILVRAGRKQVELNNGNQQNKKN